jgi:septum site-determining protein MinD
LTRVIGILSGKGGVGKSTIAINLAIALQKFRKKVMIVDCNISTPHLSHYLGVRDYSFTINDVLFGKVDINSAFYNYNGLRYIPASPKLEDLINIDLSKLKSNLKKLTNQKVDFIILDAAPGIGREALHVADASDEIIFVTNPYVPMINDVIKSKEIIKQLGEKKMSIVLNMVGDRSYELLGRIVEEVTGIPVMMEIPHDRNVDLSMVMKMPIVEYKPNSLASISFMKLASLIAEKDYELPLKFKVHRVLNKAKNAVFQSSVKMTRDLEEAKQEFLAQ